MKRKFIKAAWLRIDEQNFFKTKGDVASLLDNLSRAGIKMLFPSVQNIKGEVIYKKSDHPLINFGNDFDQLEEIIHIAKLKNIEIHPWITIFNHGLSKWAKSHPSFIDKDRFGNFFDIKHVSKRIASKTAAFLCPSQKEVHDWAFTFIEEIINNYDVSGVHLDYVRYGEFFGWCKFCRKKHFQRTGCKLDKTIPGSPEWQSWISYKTENINHFIYKVHNFTRNNSIKLSVAVFPRYPMCIESVGQNWITWCQEGWVDFVVPMNYWGNWKKFNKYAAIHARVMNLGIPVIEGLSNSKSCSITSVFRPLKTSALLIKRAFKVKEMKFSGVSFFEVHGLTENELKMISSI